MGSGKSTIGKLLSSRLHIPFVDLDEYIVREQGKSINEIFEQEGEKAFRKIESEALRLVLESRERVVLSVGGGTPCHHDGMKFIKKKSESFYLRLGIDKLMSRLKADKERPLLQNKTQDQLYLYIKNTLQERQTTYLQSTFTLRASDTPDRIVSRIIRKIN